MGFRGKGPVLMEHPRKQVQESYYLHKSSLGANTKRKERGDEENNQLLIINYMLLMLGNSLNSISK